MSRHLLWEDQKRLMKPISQHRNFCTACHHDGTSWSHCTDGESLMAQYLAAVKELTK